MKNVLLLHVIMHNFNIANSAAYEFLLPPVDSAARMKWKTNCTIYERGLPQVLLGTVRRYPPQMNPEDHI